MRPAHRVLLGLLGTLLAACAGEPRGPCSQAQPLGTVCGFENPEDVAYSEPSNLLVVSEFRMQGRGGSLAGLTPGTTTPRKLWPAAASATEPEPALGDPGCTPPDAGLFHPHGIFVDATNQLWVVQHGGRESVEIFSIRGVADEATLVWRGCIPLPAGIAGNDVAVGADGTVVVSNYMPSLDSLWGNVRVGLGWTTGDVIVWRRQAGWSHVPGTEASAPNGVALSPDGGTLYFAETGNGRFNRIGLDGSNRSYVAVEGRPDNLSWTPRGTLYLASHTSSWAFLACVRGAACRSPWALFEIDPGSLQADQVLAHDGEVVGAVASAEQVGALVYLGAVFGDRIGVWRASEDGAGSLRSTFAGLPRGRVLAADASSQLRERGGPNTLGAAPGRGSPRS